MFLERVTLYRIFILDGNLGADLDSTFIDELSFRPVSTMPLPAAIWLFASGLTGLAGFAKYKKS